MSTNRTRFEASIDKSANRRAEEAAGNVADSMDVRLAIVERIQSGAITLAQGQAELKKIKAGALILAEIERLDRASSLPDPMLSRALSGPGHVVLLVAPEGELSDTSRLSLLNTLARHRGFDNAAKALASLPLAAAGEQQP